MKFMNTRKQRIKRCKEIAKALTALIFVPEDIDILDYQEMLFDPETSTSYKLTHWYDDQLLEWFDHINKVMKKYRPVDARIIDVKRLMSGMSVREVAQLFYQEYKERGVIYYDVTKRGKY